MWSNYPGKAKWTGNRGKLSSQLYLKGQKKRPLTLYPLTLEWKSNPGSPLATGPMKRPVLDPKADV